MSPRSSHCGRCFPGCFRSSLWRWAGLEWPCSAAFCCCASVCFRKSTPQEDAMRIKQVALTGVAALALIAAANPARAETVDTRIGRLELQAGYPSKAAVEKLFDERDFQRATQAFI